MREICQSGSMSGNRKQSYANPDCGDDAEASSTATGRLTLLRRFSTLLPIALRMVPAGVLSAIAWLRQPTLYTSGLLNDDLGSKHAKPEDVLGEAPIS